MGQFAKQKDRMIIPRCPLFFSCTTYMLSLYSLIKPPKFGNCQVEQAREKHVLTQADLKLEFQVHEKQEIHLHQLKYKLDGLVATEVAYDEAFEEVCTQPEAVDRIVYYLAGFMCRKMLKGSACSECRQSLVEESEVHAQPESTRTG